MLNQFSPPKDILLIEILTGDANIAYLTIPEGG